MTTARMDDPCESTEVNEGQRKLDTECAIPLHKVPVPAKDLWGREADQRRGGSGLGLVVLCVLVWAKAEQVFLLVAVCLLYIMLVKEQCLLR